MNKFNLGDSYKEKFAVNDDLIKNFANFSSDYNPIHLDLKYAKSRGYSRQVAHGVIQLSFLSKMIGMNFPGPGSIWINQKVAWLSPVLSGDIIEIVLKVKLYSNSTKIITLSVEIFNQNNNKVMDGEAQVKITDNLSSQLKNDHKNSQDFATSIDSKEQSSYQLKSTKRVALITGGSRGIGAAIARKLSHDGYIVVINYLKDTQSANSIVEDIHISGGEAIAIKADVADPDDVKKMSNKILNEFGRNDIVIHGASPSLKLIKTEKVKYEDIALYLDTHLKGAVMLVENLSNSMIQNNFGRFIFLGSSILYGAPPQGMAAYLSSKEALWGYTKALATEMAHYGITSNMVSPGLTITDLTTEISARIKEVEAMKSPVRRLVTAEETAHHVAHLCSDQSSYINGINLPVTGGPV
jgi:3-oxoacyl-[acyl-carrier protein] reductase